MEITLLSFYFAPNCNRFKTFLIKAHFYYFISTFNDKITVVRSGKNKYTVHWCGECEIPDNVKEFFEQRHKTLTWKDLQYQNGCINIIN